MKHPARLLRTVRTAALLLLMGPAGTVLSAPTSEAHTPPERNQVLDDAAPERPLMSALRLAGESLGASRFKKRTTQEMGRSALPDMFGRYYRKERIAKISAQFREGYVMVFDNLPEVLILTGVEMGSAPMAQDLVDLNADLLKVQIQATQDREDSGVEMVSEGEVEIEGIENGLEKVYVLSVGDLPPSKYRVLFGDTGRFSLSVIFMQSKVQETEARDLLKLLGEQVRKATAHTSAGKDPEQPVQKKPPTS